MMSMDFDEFPGIEPNPKITFLMCAPIFANCMGCGLPIHEGERVHFLCVARRDNGYIELEPCHVECPAAVSP